MEECHLFQPQLAASLWPQSQKFSLLKALHVSLPSLHHHQMTVTGTRQVGGTQGCDYLPSASVQTAVEQTHPNGVVKMED